MRKTALAISFAMMLASAILISTMSARADASPALLNVLTQMRNLPDTTFAELVTWAGKGAQPPPAPVSNLEQTEANILALEKPDRRAVIWWLQGKGRSALYARGATDDEIGPHYRLVSPAPNVTPNPWRNLPLASETLNGNVQGKVQILGGFAAARRDGTAAIACVSFKNVAAIAATRVVVDFPMLTASGQNLGDLLLDRRGSFSPDVSIFGFASLAEWQQGSFGPRSRSENCIQRTLPTPALPILQARLTGYRVVRVEYQNGTAWGAPVAGNNSPLP